MTPIIYYYKFRYYRRATRPCANNHNQLVFEEKSEDQRYWQKSTRERYEQAQYYGKRVRKVVRRHTLAKETE